MWFVKISWCMDFTEWFQCLVFHRFFLNFNSSVIQTGGTRVSKNPPIWYRNHLNSCICGHCVRLILFGFCVWNATISRNPCYIYGAHWAVDKVRLLFFLFFIVCIREISKLVSRFSIPFGSVQHTMPLIYICPCYFCMCVCVIWRCVLKNECEHKNINYSLIKWIFFHKYAMFNWALISFILYFFVWACALVTLKNISRCLLPQKAITQLHALLL